MFIGTFHHGIYRHNRTGQLVKTVSDDGRWVYHYDIGFDTRPSGTFLVTHTFVHCCRTPAAA